MKATLSYTNMSPVLRRSEVREKIMKGRIKFVKHMKAIYCKFIHKKLKLLRKLN